MEMGSALYIVDPSTKSRRFRQIPQPVLPRLPRMGWWCLPLLFTSRYSSIFVILLLHFSPFSRGLRFSFLAFDRIRNSFQGPHAAVKAYANYVG